MNLAYVSNLAISVVAASTPLLIAASGELVAEKSGVLNLGVEGMMLVGAIAGFATAHQTGSALLGVGAAALAGMLIAMIFALLTLSFLANQVATGLALTIFGKGFAALLGAGYVGISAPVLHAIPVPLLSQIPFIGHVLFDQNILIYFSFVMLALIAWFLNKTHAGLILRAVGDSHDAAHAMGYPVLRIRYAAVAFGGAMAGIGGAYLSLFYSPLWSQDLTAGRGWIALALVVFSAWRPLWLLVGAYLFGGITFLSLYIQGLGIAVPSPLVSLLPYVGTVVVLVLISRDARRIRLNQPACLGKYFHAVS
ncbi:ABC transporter permease [Acidocella aminolytica]|jgi:simple sugar transport system permease protein|uniref:ABC transporter amino acid permease n=1 Tax=Acidocella aminolytica 101 = DSM 11237 TaxID=1120923 RepID=A0A0D6PBW4_9PROT|nr:ABC transporter permease [Acidocella aminolytica]GAN79142.1 ABC transporter amino acid permease [Acidocella aminolytica 101 = DSM 11237]GBQ43701.1 ABC transporter permease [Acidocella aminolytica 101 = DSM 11237]SHE66410.1 simple sugar transport system permease protein [Acidocella aminolytica 101 = DSM 11237]